MMDMFIGSGRQLNHQSQDTILHVIHKAHNLLDILYSLCHKTSRFMTIIARLVCNCFNSQCTNKYKPVTKTQHFPASVPIEPIQTALLQNQNDISQIPVIYSKHILTETKQIRCSISTSTNISPKEHKFRSP